LRGIHVDRKTIFPAVKNSTCSFLRFEQVYRGLTGHDEKKANTRKTRVDKKETIFPFVKKGLVHFHHMNKFTEKELTLMRKNKH
jgi:hypothetical protein